MVRASGWRLVQRPAAAIGERARIPTRTPVNGERRRCGALPTRRRTSTMAVPRPSTRPSACTAARPLDPPSDTPCCVDTSVTDSSHS
jgi:hypothetical protein